MELRSVPGKTLAIQAIKTITLLIQFRFVEVAFRLGSPKKPAQQRRCDW